MNFSVTDLITLITAIVALIASVRAGRKQKHETQSLDAGTRNTDADTALKYQELADKSAKAQLDTQTKLNEFSERLDAKESELDAMRTKLQEQDEQIDIQRGQITALEQLLAGKDARIDELERLTAEQAEELEALRAEVAALRSKRK
jgi:chromosome segregation ATPase